MMYSKYSILGVYIYRVNISPGEILMIWGKSLRQCNDMLSKINSKFFNLNFYRGDKLFNYMMS